MGFSRAVRVGDRVLVSGIAPVWADGSCDPDPYAQALRCFAIIVEALARAGARPDQVARTRMYLTSAEHAEVFGSAAPAAAMTVVAGLLDARWKVEIEAEAVLD